jgi:nucleotidyltransferase substrate binding protein (TIGR01987 family)
MNKSDLDISLLKDSFNTLKESYDALQKNKDKTMEDFIKDSCVKRYEYTYETARKTMGKFLKLEYDKTEKELTINNIFRDMYGLGFLKNYENWIKYREKRNITSHEYDRNKSYEIIEVIPGFIDDLKFLIDNLEKALGE